jgi:hypothetical protein
LIAELGGWIAQDSGDTDQAYVCTSRAHAYAQAAQDPAIEAMVLMRWANIVTAVDPRGGTMLAEQADEVAQALPRSRLHATIARQRANAAAVLGDRRAFDDHVARAAAYAQADAHEDELTPYADCAYIASETAAGLLLLEQPEPAVAALSDHIGAWMDGQERDHAVALARWLRAVAASGDYRTAMDGCERVITAYQRAPSVRSYAALHAITKMRDARDQLHNTALRNRIAVAIEGTRRS